MRVLKVINKETGKVDQFAGDVVRSYPTEEDIAKMRAHEKHAGINMVIDFMPCMPYQMAWYPVDEYDLEVVE